MIYHNLINLGLRVYKLSELRTPNSELRTRNSELRTPNSELGTPFSLATPVILLDTPENYSDQLLPLVWGISNFWFINYNLKCREDSEASAASS